VISHSCVGIYTNCYTLTFTFTFRTEPYNDKAAVALARLEKACDPAAPEGAFDCDLEAMDSSDNEVLYQIYITIDKFWREKIIMLI